MALAGGESGLGKVARSCDDEQEENAEKNKDKMQEGKEDGIALGATFDLAVGEGIATLW